MVNEKNVTVFGVPRQHAFGLVAWWQVSARELSCLASPEK